jgi:hypothetical protein
MVAFRRNDQEKAVEWWLKAAKSGDLLAQHYLGFNCNTTLEIGLLWNGPRRRLKMGIGSLKIF